MNMQSQIGSTAWRSARLSYGVFAQEQRDRLEQEDRLIAIGLMICFVVQLTVWLL